ncbi:MAG: hypothetical protein H0U75_06940 [Legionella sp.]|nr:hypothetical protein [Legionella sp.]
MTIKEALQYFKSGYDLCKKLGLTHPNYSKWKKQDFIPLKQQFLINQITGANLPIDIDKISMEKRIKNKSE